MTGGREAYQRRYHAIKNALTPAEKELIKFYELSWILRQKVPTVEQVTEELRKKFPTLRQTSVNYYLNRQPVQSALNKRGIPWQQHTQNELTATQIAVANVMMNFADERSNREKLDSLGVNESQYKAWLNDPQFKNLIDSLSEQNLRNIRPVAITEFTKLIQSGNWNAVKFYLETTGAVEPSGVPQSEQLVMMIIEIIQKHVRDPNVMMAIAQDIISVSGNRTLQPSKPQTLPGEFTENDPELDRAKKMIGY
jgi:hypothetical protein